MADMSSANVAYQPPVKTSWKDMSFDQYFTASPAIHYPIFHLTTLPRDVMKLATRIGIQSAAVSSPVFSSLRVTLAHFWISWRAFIPSMHRDFDGYDPSKAKVPLIMPWAVSSASHHRVNYGFTSDGSAYIFAAVSEGNGSWQDVSRPTYGMWEHYVHKNSLASWLTHAPGDAFIAPANSSRVPDYQVRNAIPVMSYYYIMYMFFMNWQTSTVPIIRTHFIRESGDEEAGYLPRRSQVVWQMPRSLMKSVIRGWLRSTQQHEDGKSPYLWAPGDPDNASSGMGLSDSLMDSMGGGFTSYDYGNNNNVNKFINFWQMCSGPAAGLMVARQPINLLETWINSESFETLKNASVVEVHDGKLIIDELIQTDRMRRFLALGFLGNANYRDWVYSQFAVTPRSDRQEPQYLGSTRFYFDYSTIIANSSTGLGDLAGLASTNQGSKMRRFSFDEYGTFMSIFTIEPQRVYPQRQSVETTIRSIAELPTPELASVGWQPKLRRFVASQAPVYSGNNVGSVSSPGPDGVVTSVRIQGYTSSLPASTFSIDNPSAVIGYEFPFIDYQTAVHRVNGSFLDTQKTWVNTRFHQSEYYDGMPSLSFPRYSTNRAYDFSTGILYNKDIAYSATRPMQWQTYQHPFDALASYPAFGIWRIGERGSYDAVDHIFEILEPFSVCVKFNLSVRRAIPKVAIARI